MPRLLKFIIFSGIVFCFLFLSSNIVAQKDSTIILDDSIKIEKKIKSDSSQIFISTDTAANFVPLTDLSDLSGDTSFVQKKHSPVLASWMSVALPGLGQAYNRKYWKIPLIYGLMGGFYYLGKQANDNYLRYLDAYRISVDDDPETIDEFGGIVTVEELEYYKDSYRRDRDWDYLLLGLVYLLNVADASVDAHMFYYDVNENLNVQLEPILLKNIANHQTFGIKFSISF